jgi:hypothetical protein
VKYRYEENASACDISNKKNVKVALLRVPGEGSRLSEYVNNRQRRAFP